jgi:hypothetical protein
MTTSAQIRRNQQNAKHSTGPRTISGKNRSRFNAVKHACTAKLVLLPAEQPAEFNELTNGFFEHFRPQNPVEVVLTQDAVYCSWQLKRCCEAKWSRMRENAVVGDIDLKRRVAVEFTELSEELFRAPNGRPTALPGGELPDAEAGQACRTKSNTATEESPARVLRGLESSPIGVSWLLMEWEALNSPLLRGEGWNAAERFRARRLLGIHPVGAYFDDHLTRLLQACQTLEPTAGSMVAEVWNEVVSATDLPALEEQYGRRIALEPAMDRETALQHLIGVIRLEVERLEEMEQEHQERTELREELAPNLAKFDFSHEGLLMTRYEFAWRRQMYRNMSELGKLNEERRNSGRGRSPYYLEPPADWLVDEHDDHDHRDDDHDHEQDGRAGLNRDDDATAVVGLDEQTPAIVARGDETAELNVAAVLRNEPKDVSLAIEGTTEDADVSLRNEPTVISEPVAVVSGNGDVEDEVVRHEGGVVRSVRFDEGLTVAMRDAEQLLRPGIRLRDSVRLGNGNGASGGRSRRERRLRKKEDARAGAR